VGVFRLKLAVSFNLSLKAGSEMALSLLLSTLLIATDMFESVNKKTVVHPLFKVGLSLLKRLPEAARLNSDG